MKRELPDAHLDVADALAAEAEEICGESIEVSGNPDRKWRELVSQLHRLPRSALCFSGGGIRSATFNLGIIQGLARCGLLPKFDYLSTVSGGGYIGGWLTGWSTRIEQRVAGTLSSGYGIGRVAGRLDISDCSETWKETPEVKFLRDYSNYLTPRTGALSVDSWTLVTTFLRNLLLNWILLIPAFLLLLLFPRLYVAFLGIHPSSLALQAILGGAVIAAVLPVAYAASDLPSVAFRGKNQKFFLLLFLLPLFVMAVLLTVYWAWIYVPGQTTASMPVCALLGLCVHVAGWVLPLPWTLRGKNGVRVKRAVVGALFAAATGAAGGAALWVVAMRLLPRVLDGLYLPKLMYACVAVPATLSVYLAAGLLYVGVMSRVTRDEDREWWARSAAWILIGIVAWIISFGLVLYGPWFLFPDSGRFWNWLIGVAGSAAGVLSAILGNSRETSATTASPGSRTEGAVRKILMYGGAIAFLMFLAALLSLVTTAILRDGSTFVFTGCCSGAPLTGCGSFPDLPADSLDFSRHLQLLCTTPPPPLVTIAGVLAAVVGFAGFFVNINTFSLHAMYRSRLIRAYLGASHERAPGKDAGRCPHPFTGFDGGDNLFMKNLTKKPFHIINTAWNVVTGGELAWQERKAVSFTVSPLHAGSAQSGYRPVDRYGCGGAGPITLGTAMAISGAAASPNMGYHSSPLITFVMAFFNLRLGWWLGNPGKGKGTAWMRGGPRFAVEPLIRETLGLTTTDSRDIYLSDGGHFENLGLYEMVRRRCRWIVVCDAGCDPKFQFEDLGNAIRKIRVDLGIEIDIDVRGIKPGADSGRYAIGTIDYRCVDGDDVDNGLLLYIKPAVTGEEPPDILNYHALHPEFPHQPTSDQWFNESQFESYRKLGAFTIEEIVAGLDVPEMSRLFHDAERQLRNTPDDKEDVS